MFACFPLAAPVGEPRPKPAILHHPGIRQALQRAMLWLMGAGRMIDSDYDYLQELNIVWLQDPFQFRYLREGAQRMSFRARGPGRHVPNMLVGYVTLKPTAKATNPGWFHRRLWWVEERDLSHPGGPIEAVDPRSVQAGKPSRKP